jgi:hypothetical protein
MQLVHGCQQCGPFSQDAMGIGENGQMATKNILVSLVKQVAVALKLQLLEEV